LVARDELDVRASVPDPALVGAAPSDAAGATDAAGPADPGHLARRSTAAALLVACRPRQWVKNVLVFAAPGAAGVLDNWTPLFQTLVAFVCFCLAASGTYLLNDVRDIASDRMHPTKRYRPIAAAEMSTSFATIAAVVLVVAGIGLSFVATWELAVTVASYVVITTAYSLYLKRIEVIELVAVAAGFVLRALAGATATSVPVSDWFFIVASFGSLFMVTGKRGAEAAELGDDGEAVRPTLASYSVAYLAYLRTLSSATVVVAYTLWAFEKAATATGHVPWYQLSILPFVLGVLRYALLLDRGHGSAPEDIVLGDRPLQVVAVAWAVVFACGIYLT
jgi:decaprenyl-phosphate phosphoribosyltransferase